LVFLSNLINHARDDKSQTPNGEGVSEVVIVFNFVARRRKIRKFKMLFFSLIHKVIVVHISVCVCLRLGDVERERINDSIGMCDAIGMFLCAAA
jgi:hypothetical protein